MHICPICNKQNATPQCSCGFDISRDYEGFPTLAPLKAGTPSSRRTKQPSKLYRCKHCGGRIFYLHPDEGICVCFKCGMDAPIPGKTQAPAPPPAEPQKKPEAPKILTYDAYMKALEQLFLVGGKKPLSQYQIDNFLRDNQLEKRFNISAGDIRRDLETIYAKYKPQTSSNQINTYDSYMKALENLYLRNGMSILTPQQIMEFVQTNQLSGKFGITFSDVQNDLRSIYAKYTQEKSKAPDATQPRNTPNPEKQNTHPDEYWKYLESLYLHNGKTPLSLSQIQSCWSSGNLFKKYGVTVGDMQKDLKTIEEKYKQYGNLASILQKKTTKDTASLSSLLSQLGKKK